MQQKNEYQITQLDEDSNFDHGVGFDNLRNKMNDLVTQMETGQLTNLHVSFVGYSDNTNAIHAGNISAGVNQLGAWSQEDSVTLLSNTEENMVQAYHTLVGQMFIEKVEEGNIISLNTLSTNSDSSQPQLQFRVR